MKTPSYYRARNTVFYNFISALQGHPVHDKSPKGPRFTDRELLKSGWVNPPIKDLLEEHIGLTLELADNTDNSPLTFVELTTFNTWFAMHPEKVCGDEYVSSSINFPIQMKSGSRVQEYVTDKIKRSLAEQKKAIQTKNYKKIKAKRRLELEAEALVLILKLKK